MLVRCQLRPHMYRIPSYRRGRETERDSESAHGFLAEEKTMALIFGPKKSRKLSFWELRHSPLAFLGVSLC